MKCRGSVNGKEFATVKFSRKNLITKLVRCVFIHLRSYLLMYIFTRLYTHWFMHLFISVALLFIQLLSAGHIYCKFSR
jgi:hypothetical protein